MKGLIIVLVLIVIVLGILYGIVHRLSSSPAGLILHLLAMIAGDYKNGAFVSEEEIAAKPRSLSGMDELCLPRIARDFPEFSWNEWRERIEEAVMEKISEQDGEIYKTVVSSYNKRSGLCMITAQTSASYQPEGAPLRHQAVFETEISYVQDADRIQGKAQGYSCPHCGAPVKTLGEKKCPYCGSAIEPVNSRVWKISRMTEK